jgi:hypothetical protein
LTLKKTRETLSETSAKNLDLASEKHQAEQSLESLKREAEWARTEMKRMGQEYEVYKAEKVCFIFLSIPTLSLQYFF